MRFYRECEERGFGRMVRQPPPHQLMSPQWVCRKSGRGRLSTPNCLLTLLSWPTISSIHPHPHRITCRIHSEPTIPYFSQNFSKFEKFSKFKVFIPLFHYISTPTPTHSFFTTLSVVDTVLFPMHLFLREDFCSSRRSSGSCT